MATLSLIPLLVRASVMVRSFVLGLHRGQVSILYSGSLYPHGSGSWPSLHLEYGSYRGAGYLIRSGSVAAGGSHSLIDSVRLYGSNDVILALALACIHFVVLTVPSAYTAPLCLLDSTVRVGGLILVPSAG